MATLMLFHRCLQVHSDALWAVSLLRKVAPPEAKANAVGGIEDTLPLSADPDAAAYLKPSVVDAAKGFAFSSMFQVCESAIRT